MSHNAAYPAGATPKPDSSASAARLVHLEGGVNFRDFGGYSTADGRTMRRGLLFRSGALDRLTKDDVSKVSRLGLRQIIDFRDPHEAMQRPNIAIPGIPSDLVPANPPSYGGGASLRQMAARALHGGDPVVFMQELYRKLPFENQAYRHMMSALQHIAEGGLLLHCMIGKDRTGVGCAIVQLALGADNDTIIEDYLITETELKDFKARAMTEFAAEFSVSEIEGMSVLMSARVEFIQATLDVIKDRFGDMEKYLEFEFGLTPDRLERLREQYLN
ncbi:MAG: tyrosine-protein phosphatase [Puniceicoccales bacterium]|jgi:protein-tyrosine phosphatase|nr:tyrosine-protein phosphatase [Puniceicoccales bacterium]